MSTPGPSPSEPRPHVLLRLVYLVLGLVFLVVGLAGVLLPGLPGTPFLLVAVWLFSMSNERLHRWMLTNPWFGRLLSDYRDGLGIPRRFKALAVVSVLIAVTASVALGLTDWRFRVGVVAVAAAGIAFILTRPTREVVLAS